MTKFLNNADIKGYIAQTAVTSYLLKADSTGRLVAAIAGTDYQAPTTALLPSGGTAGQILAKIDGTNYNAQWIDNFAQQIKYDVKLGAALSKGTPVYVSSANGTNIIVSASSNATEATSSKTLGLLEAGGALNDIVKVVSDGLLSGLNTSTASIGDPVWLGVNGALIFGLANKPSAPAHLVYIGAVTRVHATNGEIFIKVQNGFELDELHNVALSSVADGQGLFYESATSLWKNKTIASVLGYTPANDSTVVHLAGTETITGVKTFSSVINASTLSLNGGTLAGNNIVSMRSNPTGGQFRIEKSDGSLSAYPFYIGADGTALAYYYNAAGALKVLLHTNGTSYFGNSLSVGYSTYAATSYSLDVNGSAQITSTLQVGGNLYGVGATFSNAVTIGNYDGQALKFQSATSTGSSYLRFYNSAGTSRGYFGLFWSGTTDYMVLDAGATELNFGSSNKFTFTGGGPAIFSGALTANSDVTISTGSIKMYSVQNVAGQYRYIGTEYAAGNGNNRAEIRFGIDGADTKTKITLHTANGGGQINEVLGVYATGQFKLNNYTTSTSFSGTAAGYLAFDSSGNIITVAGVAATDNTKLPLAGGTMTGLLAFSNVTGNKIDFYHTTTGSGDRYGIQVQNSELRIHSGAGGDGSGGITFGKSTTTTFTETMRVRNDGIVNISGYLRTAGVTSNTVYWSAGTQSADFGNVLGQGTSSRSTMFRGNGSSTSVWWAGTDGNGTVIPFTAIDATSGEFSFWRNSGGTGGGDWTRIMTMNASGLTINSGGITLGGIQYSTYNTATGIANNGFNTAKTIIGNYHIQNGAGLSGDNKQAAITFQGGSASEAQAGIYVSNNNSSGTAMGFATTDSYATGPQLFMTATNAGVVNFPRAVPTYAGTSLVYNSGTWGINVTGSSRSLLFSGDSAKAFLDGLWAGGGSYPGYQFTGGNSRFGFSSTGGVVDIYADGNFYATDSSYLVWHQGNLTNLNQLSNGPGYITSSATVAGLNTEFLGTGSTNISSGYSRVIRNENGSGGNPNYAPVLHLAASDTMWQITGAHGGSTTLVWRSGYAGNWSTPWWNILHSGNVSSYALPISGGTLTGALAVTAGDRGFEVNTSGGISFYSNEINAGALGGTGNLYLGWRRTSSVNIGATLSVSASSSNFGPDSGNDNGIGIRYGNYASGYGRIRFYQDGSNHQAIHSFSATWQNGTLAGASTGAINISGQNGVTFGDWNNPDAYIVKSGQTYARGYRGIGNVAGTGEATYHPAGIYSTGNNWLYGNIMMAGYSISGAASISGSGLITGGTIRSNTNVYTDQNYGYGLVGVYASTRYQGVFAMGDAYKLSADGTTPGNLYGLSWSHPNAGGIAGNLNTHGLLVMENGTFLAAISGNIKARDGIIAGSYMYAPSYLETNGPVYATIMYDNNDRSYYVDPNSMSQMSGIMSNNWFRPQGDTGLYSQDYGGYFRRNTNSYGTWESTGYAKNGWGGYVNNNNYIVSWMLNTSGDFGFLTQNGNWWNLFYNNGNNCWGIGTDNTYSGDGFRCIKYGSSQYGWTTWSDRRAKENISNITGALDKVLNMRGVYFNYISDEAKNKRVGFIAQELEGVLPEAVRYAEEIDEYNVEYAQIVSVLAEAIKEQNAKIQTLEDQLQTLLN